MKIDLTRAVEVLTACGYECPEIESLRQQLASRDAEVAELNKQVTLLRDALMFCQSKIAYMLRNGEWYNPELALDTAREALAATEPKEQWK